MDSFSYATAFSRNLGWVTEWEQEALRGKTVAMAGLGGVGGAHLLTLTRMGIGGFSIADFDRFDLVNFNRQVGATMATLDRPKLEVMAEMALAINPTLRLRRFPEGVRPEDVDTFLEGADLFVDGFDFFELGIRRAVFRRCAELGIPAITAAPIGLGTNWLIFLPEGQSFEAYFRFEGQPEAEQYLRFLMGLAPQGKHRRYLVDPSRVDLAGRTGPSTAPSCQLCAAVVGVEALKILLGRGGVRPAPVHHHFDPYLGTFHQTRLRWGQAGPGPTLKRRIARPFYLKALQAPRRVPSARRDGVVSEILSLARWAPSGDNVQPWRFEVLAGERVRVHFRRESGNPYEYRNGEPSLLSFGMLLETIRLAATLHGRRFRYALEQEAEGGLVADGAFSLEPDMVPDPLAHWISARSVVRRAMGTRRLGASERTALEAALGPGLRVRWFETGRERWRFALLGARVTDIRLRMQEAYAVHRRVIDWERRHSATGIPAEAIGLDRATTRLMRWAMRDWQRVARLNRWTGTGSVAAQLDLWPGLRSAGFFAVVADEVGSEAALVAAGSGVQRFWLMATKLSLGVQPALAILMAAHYGRTGEAFTGDRALRMKAARVGEAFSTLMGPDAERCVFLGRIGQLPAGLPRARSVRRPVEELIVEGEG